MCLDPVGSSVCAPQAGQDQGASTQQWGYYALPDVSVSELAPSVECQFEVTIRDLAGSHVLRRASLTLRNSQLVKPVLFCPLWQAPTAQPELEPVPGHQSTNAEGVEARIDIP